MTNFCNNSVARHWINTALIPSESGNPTQVPRKEKKNLALNDRMELINSDNELMII